MSDNTADCDVSDPYVEHLRKKYLQKYDGSRTLSSDATKLTSDVESFAPLPANPSLTESERKHYNRAMKELGKALKLSEDHLKASLSEFEKTMKSSNEGSEKIENTSKSANETQYDEGNMAPERDVLYPSEINGPWHRSLPSGALPSTIQAESQDALRTKRTTTTFASSEDPALFWDEESSTQTGISRKFYSNSDSDPGINMPDIKAMYAELMGIYRKLQHEKGRIAERQLIEEKLESNFDAQAKELAIREAFLLEKEKELLERERNLSVNLQNIKKTKEIVAKLQGVELEVQEKMDLMQQKHQLEIDGYNSQLAERAKELKRMKNSFDVLKEHNDELRTKLDDVTSEYQKAKTQNNKLKKRLDNLQRRQDFRACKPQHISENSFPGKIGKENFDSRASVSSLRNSDKYPKQFSNMFDTLAVLFDWLSESGLSTSFKLPSKDFIGSEELTTDKCIKILPLLVDIIKILPSQPSQKKNQLPFLSFLYFCLCRIDESQHSLLSSTTRRLGDELYKPHLTSVNSQKSSSASLLLATTASSAAFDSVQGLAQSERIGTDDKSYPNAYFRSNNPEVRLLSCFIILKTLHQVDVLAHVFGQMKRDLKTESNRKMFLSYHATDIVLPYITYRANKALMGDAVDAILQMSMESVLLPGFLEQCSTEQWFRAFSSALRSSCGSVDKPPANTTVLEKLSVILQKLSKIKTNRKFFDAFSMGRNLQECYRCCDPKNTFLTLNLRSILFNLNLLKDSQSGS